MPPSASSNLPTRRCSAPVNAPFSWPNSSDAIRSLGMTAQFTATNAREHLGDRRWIARAMSSLPVPVSPVMNAVESVGATLLTRESTVCKAGEFPTMSSNIDALSTSSRRATFSWKSWSRRFRISSNAFLDEVMSWTAPTSSRIPDSSLTASATTWTCLTEPSGATRRCSKSIPPPLWAACSTARRTRARSSGWVC